VHGVRPGCRAEPCACPRSFITESDGVRAEDLLGLNPQRTGGMKANNLNQVVGPKKLFDAQHFDCQVLQVSLQVRARSCTWLGRRARR
jgi:hypothetical protein